jgi:hypothetical protein
MSEKQMKFSEPNPSNNISNIDITNNNPANINSAKTPNTSYFSHVSDFFQNNKYIVIGVIVLLVAGYFAYKYYYSKDDENEYFNEIDYFKQPNKKGNKQILNKNKNVCPRQTLNNNPNNNLENDAEYDNVEDDNVEDDNVEDNNVEDDNVEDDNVEDDNVEDDNVEDDNEEYDNVEDENAEYDNVEEDDNVEQVQVNQDQNARVQYR